MTDQMTPQLRTFFVYMGMAFTIVVILWLWASAGAGRLIGW